MARFIGKGKKKTITPIEKKKNYLKDIVDILEIDDCISYKNIDIYPIHISKEIKTNLLTLDEAMRAQIVEIIETGTVSELIIKNKSSEKQILILEGTIVKGGMQNRIINTTFILDKESESKVPTTCVEQRRWSYNIPNDFFGEAGTRGTDFSGEARGGSVSSFSTFIDTDYASPTLFCAMNASVSSNLKSSGSYLSDQAGIWETIAGYNKSLGVDSSTGDFTKAYRDKEKDVTEYYDQFKDNIPKNINGLLAVIGGKKIFMNLSSDSEIMRVRIKPFLKSVILESFAVNVSNEYNSEKLITFLNNIKDYTEHKNKSGDIDGRIKINTVIGSIYIHDSEVIFLTITGDM